MQVGLALVLGIGAGLMLRSVWNLQRVDPGFDPRGVLAFRLQTTSKYRVLTTGIPYLQQVTERFAALPGVTAVGAIGHLPMSGYSWTHPTSTGRSCRRPPGESAPRVAWRFIWGDYFEAMRIPLTMGRRFADTDTAGAPPVAIVNETLATRFFGGAAAALGQRLVQRAAGGPATHVVEIVGVVRDVRHDGLERAPRPRDHPAAGPDLHVPDALRGADRGRPRDARGAGARGGVCGRRHRARSADLQSLPSLLASSLGRPRLLALLLSVFAAIGVLLSVVGLYGVVAVRVRQREREIGIRMALGATAQHVAAGVVRHGLLQTAVGVLVGLPAAFGLTRFMESVVFGVTTRDPITFGALPVLLGAVAALACYLPARRAARVDPVVAIRTDGS